MAVEVYRNLNEKGRLVAVTITTSGGEQADITWDKSGESTLLYGRKGGKKHRVVGVRKFEMGDGDRLGKRSNVVEINGQEIIRKTPDIMVVDNMSIPSNQVRVDLNAWSPRETEEETKKFEEMRKTAEMRKMATLAALLDLEKDEVPQVMAFAKYLKDMRENG